MKRGAPLQRLAQLNRKGKHRRESWISGATVDSRLNGHKSARERFWELVQRADGDGCWEWQGRRVRGYGQIDVLGRATYAHRFSYEINVGPIPPGLDVLHNCDNTACVRPDHLRPGTHDDNMKDMSDRGRAVGGQPKKLSPEDVEAIRSSNDPTAHLAARFDVSGTMIRRIRQRGTSYSRRPRNFPFMSWIKTQPCRVSELDPAHRCDGPVQADHIGEIGTRGGGRKCADEETIPLCRAAHEDRGARRGFFAGWSTERLRSWADAETARYRATYNARRRGLEGVL